MSYIEKEKLIKADIASIENRVRHAFNQGYDLGFNDGKKRAKPLEQEPFINKPCVSSEVCEHDKQNVLDKIRAEIKAKIEEEEFARSVFRHEEKDTAKAEQCTGSIFAYNNVIRLIDKYTAESAHDVAQEIVKNNGVVEL